MATLPSASALTLDKPKISPETGALRKSDYFICFAVAAVALLVFVALFSFKYEGLRSNDQFDYSQLARNIYRGEGFVTKALTPIELAIDPRINNHPDYWRSPLYPLMISIAYFLVGVKTHAGVLVSGFFFILLAPMVYLFGRKASGRMVGVAAAAITIFLPQMWDYSLTALTEMSFAFLLVLLLYAVYAGANPLITGAIFGLCYLHRYNALIYLPAIAWFFVVVDKYKWREVGLFCAGALLVMLPWLIRNAVLVGNPFFSLLSYAITMNTRTFPSSDFFATFHPMGPLTLFRQHPCDMVEKYLRGLSYFNGEIPRLTHPAIMLFFFAGLLAIRMPRRLRFALYTVIIMIFIQVHFLAIYYMLIRLFVPFIPLITLSAVITFDYVLRLAPWPKARPALMGLAILAVIATSVGEGWSVNYAPLLELQPQEAEYVARRAGGAAVATDQTWELAWKADLIGIWTPETYGDFEKYLSAVDYVLFSGRAFTAERAKIYRSEYSGNPAFNSDFALEKTFDDGAMLFVRRQSTGSKSP